MSSLPASHNTLTAFAGFHRIAFGPRAQVLKKLRATTPSPDALLRVFDDATGERLDFDLRPEAAAEQDPSDIADEALVTAAEAPATRGVGRPKLGVVAREVTLLPRHWEWLNRQPGGASVALRKLVEDSRRANEGRDLQRTAREAAYRFMTEIAGDLAGFEEATRALFADDRTRFESLVAHWPADVKQHLTAMATSSWSAA